MLICLFSIISRVNAIPFKRMTTLNHRYWHCTRTALGLAASYKTNLLSQEDRHILTFQRLPYLLLNLLLAVYIYIIICLCTSDPFICGGFWVNEIMSVFVFGGTSTHKAPPKCKEHFNRCWFFSHPLNFSLFSSRVKHTAYFPSENRPSFKKPNTIKINLKLKKNQLYAWSVR